jgi:hypothetical protein
MATTAIDLLAIAFSALSADEQEEAFERLSEQRLQHVAETDSMTGRCLRSLLRVQEHVGRVPSIEDHRRSYRLLTDAGEELEETSRSFAILGHGDGPRSPSFWRRRPQLGA